MLNKAIMLTLTVLFFTITASSAATIESMQLVGKGEAHYLRFIKVYDASLYTTQSVMADDILKPDISKCLNLEYKVAVGREDFITAANTVLDKQFSKKELSGVEGELEHVGAGNIHLAASDLEAAHAAAIRHKVAVLGRSLYRVDGHLGEVGMTGRRQAPFDVVVEATCTGQMHQH